MLLLVCPPIVGYASDEIDTGPPNQIQFILCEQPLVAKKEKIGSCLHAHTRLRGVCANDNNGVVVQIGAISKGRSSLQARFAGFDVRLGAKWEVAMCGGKSEKPKRKHEHMRAAICTTEIGLCASHHYLYVPLLRNTSKRLPATAVTTVVTSYFTLCNVQNGGQMLVSPGLI